MQGQLKQTMIKKLLTGMGMIATLLTPSLSHTAPINTALLWQPGWRCGQATVVSKKFVQNLITHGALFGYRLNNKPLPLLLGQDPENSGTILFVQYKGKWRSYPIAQGSTVLSMYSTPAYNRLTLFATWGNQGLGNDYIALNGTQQLSQFSCTTVHLPAELDRPDWHEHYPGLHDFNMDTTGKGSLISAAYVNRGKQAEKHWYRYQTSNWGKQWSEARTITPPKTKTAGIFQAAKETPPERGMINSLLKGLR